MIVQKILSKKAALVVAEPKKEETSPFTTTSDINAAFSERAPKYIFRRFKHQHEYEQWLACVNVEKGDVLVYETTPNLRASSYASIHLVLDVVQDYFNLEWTAVDQPKAFLLVSIQQYPSALWEAKNTLETIQGFRKLTDDELDWLIHNANLQDKIKQHAPGFVFRNKAV